MNLDLDFLIIFMSAKTCSESTEKANKKYNEDYKPVRVVQFLLLAFECNNLFPKPIDSWPMGTVSLPKENRLDPLSRLNASRRRIDTPHTNRVSVLRVQTVRETQLWTAESLPVHGPMLSGIDLLDMQVWPNILLSKISCCSCLLYFSFLFYKTEIKKI